MPSKGKKHATRSKKYTKGTPRTNPGFRKKVLSVIKRTQEVKINVQSQDSQNIQFYDPNLGSPSNMTYLDLKGQCISQINQGVDNNSRIGTKINIRSWVIKGSIVSINTANRPFYVKAIVLKSKENTDYSTNLFNDLYERQITGSAPLNTLADIYTPIDKDNYTVYAMRVFKLGPSTSSTNPNNDFSVSRMFSINMTKHFKKFEWGDTGNGPVTSPNNLYMIFVGCNADNTNCYGGASGTWNGPISQYSWTSTVRFTDD